MTPQTATVMQPTKAPAITRQTAPENVFDRFQKVFDSIEKRAYEIFDNNGRLFGNDLSDWLQAESEILHPVHLEIAETDEALTVKAEVPGFTVKELEILMDGSRLTIAGKHESREESKKCKTIYSDLCAKEIFRSVELPADVDSTKVTATLKDGVLNLEFPKAALAKNLKIEPKEAS